jgi:histidyl-tRNA synthetase
MEYALRLAQDLRSAKISVELAFGDRSLKGAMKAADKSGARYAVVLGDSELEGGTVSLKRMSDGEVTSVKITELRQELGERSSR